MTRKTYDKNATRQVEESPDMPKAEHKQDKGILSRVNRTQPGQGAKRQRIGRLKTPSDVAKFMARCIKRAARGDSPGIQYNLTNMSSQLLRALESAELEKRIEALERKANGKP